MKKIAYIFLFFVTIAFLSSCQKNYVPDNEPTTPKSFEDENYSPTFNWATSRVVEFVISSPTDALINITSADAKIRYNRGMFFAKDKTCKVKLCVPITVTQLRINGKIVEINADIINYDLI